ncbi:MAG: bifunctional [glutamate--ammonia ligase]-adenylyl-L-tyrosine phosphorylase/[glutamate--ammonia-ligase] adenylyltransferase [Candidatus Sumerlaeaceae bacterium]
MIPHPLTQQVRVALEGGLLEHPGFLSAEQSTANVRLLAPHFPNVQELAALIDTIGKSAAPDMALNNLERFIVSSHAQRQIGELISDRDDVRHALVTLFAGSQFLSEVLIAQPGAFDWLIEHNQLWSVRTAAYYRETVREQIEGLTELVEQRRVLNRWRRREMLRIGMRDLLVLATMEEVTRDISDLAQAIIHLAAELTYQQTAKKYGHPVSESASWDTSFDSVAPGEDAPLPAAAGMCVLGMGKLGGRELNFSSDIDLVFIYEAEGQTTGRFDGTRRVAVTSNHSFFARMGQALVKFLAERGPDGNLFRVDMRLRPEGQDGPLVRSLESFITYLSSQARDWERIAYLKARVLSGPSHLTERLYRVVSRFVYAGVEAAQIIREIQELKLRIDREVIISDLYEREVKRGYGGIREIEFVVAAMQIIHGYTHHALRVRNVFLAVQRLQEVHILSDEEAMFYLRAYSFLRLIEHRLQMAEEHQTHTLPADPHQLEQLARRCGYVSAAAFETHYRETTHEVHRRFIVFFEEDVALLDEEKKDLLLITDRDAPPDEVAKALQRRGINHPEAVRLLHVLAFGTREVFVSPEGQRSFQQMLPSLLRLTAAAPLPGRVLPNLHSFAMAMKGITYYYEVIAQHPEILRMLVLLFGTSNFYSQALIAQPEYFDALISSRVLEEVDADEAAKRQRMSAVLQGKLQQRKLTMLRRATHFENLLTALRYLLKLRPLADCLRQLSTTADLCIDVGMRLVAEKISSKNEPMDRGVADALYESVKQTFAVIAFGKYGGQELNFFGDLDVVFVFKEAERAQALAAQYDLSLGAFYTSVADTLTFVLSENIQGGRAYVLDARLRPHGRNAPHATPLSQYVEYLSHEAQIWELQSLTRARLVWGDSESLDQVQDAAKARIETTKTKTLQQQFHAMRMRLEAAAAEDHEPSHMEFKRAAGGLVDIEFLLQYLALAKGVHVSANYFDALADARLDAPLIGQRERLLCLYRDFRSLETITRLLTDAGTSLLPADPQLSGALTRMRGLQSAEQLHAWLRDRMVEVRSIYQQQLAGG